MPWNLWKDVWMSERVIQTSRYTSGSTLRVQSGHSSKHSLKRVEGSRYSTRVEEQAQIYTRAYLPARRSPDGGRPSKKPRYHGVVARLFRLSTRPRLWRNPRWDSRNSHENRKCTRLIFESSERSNSICPSARKTVAGQKVIPSVSQSSFIRVPSPQRFFRSSYCKIYYCIIL